MTLIQVPAPSAPPPPDEEALVAQLRRGEMDALSGLYQIHATALFGLARHLMGSVSDAEDVVQDLFVGLPEAIQRYRDQGSLRGWLRRITVRLALMRIRSGKLRREEQLHDESSSVGGTTAERIAVRDAMDQLSLDDRAIVILKVVEGYDHTEIAELLGIRRGTSEVRLHRALARLRRWLEEEQ